MEKLEEIKKSITESNTICLATHIHPDGDAVGSIGAMYHFLKEIGKEVYMLLPNLDDTFCFLEGLDERIETLEKDEYDLLIILDTSNTERVNICKEDLLKAKSIIVIDHHKNNQIQSDVKLVNEDAPANCEIVYDLMKYMGHSISKSSAQYIYTGIMTDTGSFNFERTSSKTHNIAGEMIDLGVDSVKICNRLNHTYTESRMKLLACVINNMEVYFGGKVRVGFTDLNTRKELNLKETDMQSIINYLKGIENTIVAIYIRELVEGGYKVSIRASEPIDSAEISAMFGGGGHKRAAGFSTNDIEETKKRLIEILERLLESENNRNS